MHIEPETIHPKYLPFHALSETRMPHSIPQEILDLIIDYLRDQWTTLKICCIVSKAWIERTRKYLFANINFRPPGRRVGQWSETFPDPTNSPAYHTRTLSISRPQHITATNTETLLTFYDVVHLNVDTDLLLDHMVSLAPLHGFSPVLRSLHLTFASLRDTEIFYLICSFPLLEDLVLVSRTRRRNDERRNTPSTSPRLTGSLELRLIEGIRFTTYRLLDLPNGLHFTKIALPWLSEGDVLPTMHLVSSCSGTLESLDIANHLAYEVEIPSLDLSRATKLRDVVFRCRGSNIQWVTAALHTVNSINIQQISLELSIDILWGGVHREWLNLDSLLVQFWTSHALRLKVMYETSVGWRGRRDHVARLLPEVMRRGIVDVVEDACEAIRVPYMQSI